MFLKNNELTKKSLSFLFLIFVIANMMVFSDKKSFYRSAKGYDVIYYSEGLSGTVTVLEKGNIRGLIVDGQYVAGTDPVLTIDSKMLAHLPLLISDNPDNVIS